MTLGFAVTLYMVMVAVACVAAAVLGQVVYTRWPRRFCRGYLSRWYARTPLGRLPVKAFAYVRQLVTAMAFDFGATWPLRPVIGHGPVSMLFSAALYSFGWIAPIADDLLFGDDWLKRKWKSVRSRLKWRMRLTVVTPRAGTA